MYIMVQDDFNFFHNVHIQNCFGYIQSFIILTNRYRVDDTPIMKKGGYICPFKPQTAKTDLKVPKMPQIDASWIRYVEIGDAAVKHTPVIAILDQKNLTGLAERVRED